MKGIPAIILCCLLIVQFGFAQKKSPVPTSPASLSNLRKKTITVTDRPLALDSFSMVPNSWIIRDIPSSMYSIDPVNATLTWIAKPPVNEVFITYRVFPYKFNAVTKAFNYDSIKYNFTLEPLATLNRNQDTKLFDFGTMNYNGSFGKGISFGNNQDAVLNSSLNLQINGFLGDSLELTAAITDNNIPIQPEGNTQDLRDFDRIFMQIKKKGWQANFGDIDIRQSKNYFLNFYKRLQGVSFQTDNKIGPHIFNSLLLSGAVAKGKFNRNVIVALEGNQGPYRLTSPNNELYFVVLANTERVFINGELMTRGEDQDYVINYNTAEITFTPKRLITKDSRIQVEFEYADRNFLNSQLYLNDEVNINKKLKLSLGAFSNVDAKNSPINQTLDAKQKQFLSAIGDKLDSARYENAQRDSFSVNKILYKKVDTLYAGGVHDSAYVYSVNPSDTLYNVSFLFVGPGKGNYTTVNNNANGKVFQWMAPVSGVPQGDWAPVVLLVTPKKLQLMSVGAEYAVNAHTLIKSEVAMSNYDVNTFSSKDKTNDKGYAAKLQAFNQQDILRSFHKGLTMQTEIGYEYVQDKFKPLERLRNVEFNRDWSLPFDAPAATEKLLNASVKLSDKSNNYLKYEVYNYLRSDQYNGVRQTINHYMVIKGWKVTDQFNITNITSPLQNGNYTRPSIEISKQLKDFRNIQVGASYSGEHNKQLSNLYDTLTPLSFGFDIYTVFIKSSDAKKNKWGVNYFTRTDQYPFQKLLLTADKSHNINVSTELLKNENRQFKLNLTYRKLEVIHALVYNQNSEQSLLGRIEYFSSEWKGLVTTSILYELGAGQEQKREYTYVQVPAPQGQYTWIDYNGDGIPQLNEFEIAVFDDQKTYIRVYSPTNQYVKANYIQFNYSVDLNPKVVMPKNVQGFRKVLSKITTTSTLQITKKDISSGTFEFNPFSSVIADTALILLNSFLSNTFYYDRVGTKWGFDVSHRLNQTKSLLTYGFESIKISDLSLRARWNFNRSVLTSITNHYGINELATPKFANRNYQVRQVSVEPAVSYVYGNNVRVVLTYKYDKKQNQTGLQETSQNNEMSAECRYNVLSNSTLNGKFTYSNISFDGSPNSSVGYLMLDGLLPGRNLLWSLDLTKRLAGNIELNLRYEGRKPGTTRTIHTGGATLRAIF